MEIETRQTKYSIIGDLCSLISSELKSEYDSILVPQIKTRDARKYLRKELTDEEILENLSSCVSLVLSTVEDCVFRCGYCVYSGKYEGERVHSQNSMDIKTAEKAVDLFLETVSLNKRKKKRRNSYIGFYGGESLLEFNLVKDVIKYVEEKVKTKGLNKKFNILYRLTTNGYLLNEEVADYLKAKDVLVDVSLDGPEEEHDKFRVTISGEKTWAKIMANLKKIKEKHPDYYNNRISFLVTLHPNHDSKAIDRFFMENPQYFKPEKIKFNSVNLDRLRKEEKKLLTNKTGTPGQLYFSQICRDFDAKFKFKMRGPDTPMTATCFPGGERVFVNADGRLNICEKMSHEAPGIGHVNHGFDFDAIRRIIKDYNEEIIKNKCWECNYWFLCNICITNAFNNGKFKFNCSIEKSYGGLLTRYLEHKEESDDQKYRCLNAVHDIGDFIDSL